MTLLYKWLTDATRAQGSAKALVYRDTYLSWRGLSHRVDRRVQEFSAMGIKKGDWVGLMLGNVPDFAILALALSKVGYDRYLKFVWPFVAAAFVVACLFVGGAAVVS